MALIMEAKWGLRRRSKRRSERIQWCIRFCSRITRDSATADRCRWGRLGRGGVEEDEVRRNRGLTGKKYWNRFRKRPGGECLRSRRKKRSKRFTRRLRKNCAISTAWVIRRTKIPGRDITSCM